jgi:Mce-associated membrane protein
MTNPKSEKSEGESAAVGVRTDAQRKQASAKAKTTDPVESDREDNENGLRAEDSGEVDTISPNGDDGDQSPETLEPGETKRRIGRPRARARSVIGQRGSRRSQPRVAGVSKAQSESADDESGERDEEPVHSEAEKPCEDPDLLDALDSDEAEAALSDDADAEETADDADVEETAGEAEPAKIKRRISWPQVVVYGLLPALALVLAGAAGFLKWQDSSARETQLARIESLAAAKDSTIALLSYKSDTVEKDLEAAKSRMTGAFKDSYSQLINDVVIPGAKKEHISATATVPAAASVSATPNHAVALLFVNQTAVVDKSPPADSVSSVRVTLDKVDGRWLISGFDPV